ncbi:hypothetical protein HMPREF3037_00371 [Candidatus Stoquefichus sp. KLE1796]|nr:hypothetical protein HMPREF3037_00371 [Candidatus Stoquefichus sp. KLE1796]
MNEKEKIERDSFVFYRSFYEAIKDLDTIEQSNLLCAICELALNGNEIELNGISSTIFKLIKPQINANLKRYKNGSKGGRPKTENKPKENQSKTKHKANVNVNVNVNENIYVHFDAFWKLYPRKVNKKKAKDKFLKVCKDEKTFNAIMRGLKKQMKSVEWQNDGGKYIPHPTTWLNGERWLDEIDESSDDSNANDMTAIADEIFGDEDE